MNEEPNPARRHLLVEKLLRERRRRAAPAPRTNPLNEDTRVYDASTDALTTVGAVALERATHVKEVLTIEGHTPGEATVGVLALLNEMTEGNANQLRELTLSIALDSKDCISYQRLYHCVRALEKHLPSLQLSQLHTRTGQRKLYDFVRSAIETHEAVAEQGIGLSYDQIFDLMMRGQGPTDIIETATFVAEQRDEEAEPYSAHRYTKWTYGILDESLQKGCTPRAILDREFSRVGPSLEEYIRQTAR